MCELIVLNLKGRMLMGWSKKPLLQMSTEQSKADITAKSTIICIFIDMNVGNLSCSAVYTL